MDWKFVVPLLLLWPALWLIKVVFVTRNLLGLRIGGSRWRRIEFEQLPAHLRTAVNFELRRLVALGFQPRQTLLAESPNDPAFDRFYVDFGLGDEPVRALVAPHAGVENAGACVVSLCTLRVNGPDLVTRNASSVETGTTDPNIALEVLAHADPATLLRRHRERVAAVEREGAWLIVPNNRAIVWREQNSEEDSVARQLAAGLIARQSNGCNAMRVLPAVRTAIKLLRASKKKSKAAAPTVEVVCPPPTPEAQLEFDWTEYRRVAALQRGRLALPFKIVLTLVSLVAFVAALGWTTSWSTAIAVLVALTIHEGGHLVGMWIFGHRDTQLLFLPFFGGVAMSLDQQPLAPWKELVVLFLGPLPGLFAGLLVMFGPQVPVPWVADAAQVFVFLNAFNLLPVLPLDGGRILDSAVAQRFPRTRVGFIAASGIALALCGLGLGTPMLMAPGIFMLMRLAQEWRTAAVLRELRGIGSPEDTEETVARRLLRRVREADWSSVAVPQRLAIVRHLQLVLRQPLPGLGTIVFAAALYLSPLVLLVGLGVAQGVSSYFSSPRRATAAVAPSRPVEVSEISAPPPLPDPKSIPPEQNGAIPFAAAIAVGTAHWSSSDGEPSPQELNKQLAQVAALLHDAAQRPRFAPEVSAKSQVAEVWTRSSGLALLVQSAQQKLEAGDVGAASAEVRDACTLLRQLRALPGWWTHSSDSGIVGSLLELAEEASARDVAWDDATRDALLSATEEPATFAFARIALPAEHLAQSALMSDLLDQAAQNAESRAGRWLWKIASGASRPDRETIEDQKRVAGALAHALDEAAKGRWPAQPPESDYESASGITRFTVYSELATFAQQLARGRQLRAALAVQHARKQLGRSPKDLADAVAPWCTNVTAHPLTGLPLRLVVHEGKRVLTFAPDAPAPKKPTPAKPADAEDDGDEEDSPHGTEWRLPAAS